MDEESDRCPTENRMNTELDEFIIDDCIHKICFVIPARLTSTRLPNKLLLSIGEKTCIQHTITQVAKSKYFNDNIIVLTDHKDIKDNLNGYPCNVIMTSNTCKNGTERISTNMTKICHKYTIIVNIQADEPFISAQNIDFCIYKHIYNTDSGVFYTTLHEKSNSKEYLLSTASLKVVIDINDNVLYYSRNVIPSNKTGILNDEYVYNTFTGIYVFNRDMIELYARLNNGLLQIEEDCEQLKILEAGYKIKSFPTVEYNEISLNTFEDYRFLMKKYIEKHISYLDCTIRDGGYTNDWKFDDKFITEYITIMDTIGIDYVEIGFVNKTTDDRYGTPHKITKEYANLFINHSFRICAMGNYGDIDIDSLKIGLPLDMVRVAFHKKNCKPAIQKCIEIKKLGYKVSANIMAITNYSDHEILELIKLINESEVDVLCIADSFGSMSHHDLLHIVNILESSIIYSSIGIHLHNNMNNAFSNYTCVKSAVTDRNYIFDSTLFGIGRGAGNLQTELIFHRQLSHDILCNLILFIDEYIRHDKKCLWGYDLDYLYSGLYNVHPNYVIKLREYDFDLKKILSTLHHIANSPQKNYFDSTYLDTLI